MTVKGSRVVIIGGTSGIGLATAEAALHNGAQVVIGSRRQSSLDTALSRLPGAEGYLVDSSSSESLRGFFEVVGPFDHFAYTAGEALNLMKLADFDIIAARTFFDLRFFRALEAAHLAAKQIRAGGSITFMSGSAAIRPSAGWTLGAAVSASMIAVTEALAQELAPIRVNAIAPGIARSAVWGLLSDDEQQAMYAHLADTLPLGRAGEVEDIAKAYIYVMDQNYATGTTTVVDGGSVLV